MSDLSDDDIAGIKCQALVNKSNAEVGSITWVYSDGVLRLVAALREARQNERDMAAALTLEHDSAERSAEAEQIAFAAGLKAGCTADVVAWLDGTQAGTTIGHTLDARPIVMPERSQRHDIEAWFVARQQEGENGG